MLFLRDEQVLSRESCAAFKKAAAFFNKHPQQREAPPLTEAAVP
jgi:hypothetical protein